MERVAGVFFYVNAVERVCCVPHFIKLFILIGIFNVIVDATQRGHELRRVLVAETVDPAVGPRFLGGIITIGCRSVSAILHVGVAVLYFLSFRNGFALVPALFEGICAMACVFHVLVVPLVVVHGGLGDAVQLAEQGQVLDVLHVHILAHRVHVGDGVAHAQVVGAAHGGEQVLRDGVDDLYEGLGQFLRRAVCGGGVVGEVVVRDVFHHVRRGQAVGVRVGLITRTQSREFDLLLRLKEIAVAVCPGVYVPAGNPFIRVLRRIISILIKNISILILDFFRCTC